MNEVNKPMVETKKVLLCNVRATETGEKKHNVTYIQVMETNLFFMQAIIVYMYVHNTYIRTCNFLFAHELKL